MLLQNDHNLEETLVLVLAERPGMEAGELIEAVAARGRRYSQPAVYKELKKLVAQGVLLKTSKRFYIHFNWAVQLLSLSRTIARQYLESSDIYPSLLPGQKRVRWQFNDLLRLNDLWSCVVLNLLKGSSRRVHLSWNPHTWFHFVQTTQEAQFFESLRFYGVKMFKMVGGRSFLDRLTVRYWDPTIVTHSFAPGPFENDRATYFSVIDDHITTVKLNIGMAREIDSLYDRTTSAKTLDIQAIFSLFQSKVEASLTLEHNPAKARRIERAFSEYFGVKFDSLQARSREAK